MVATPLQSQPSGVTGLIGLTCRTISKAGSENTYFRRINLAGRLCTILPPAAADYWSMTAAMRQIRRSSFSASSRSGANRNMILILETIPRKWNLCRPRAFDTREHGSGTGNQDLMNGCLARRDCVGMCDRGLRRIQRLR